MDWRDKNKRPKMKQKSLLFGEIAVKGELNELFKVKTKAKTKSLDKDKETPVNVTAAPIETPRIEEDGDGEEEVAVTFCEQEDQVGEVKKVSVESSTSSAATAFTRREKIAEIIEKNSRTLFVGNLPTAVIEKAPTALLKSHFSAFGPLESIRFRSLVCALEKSSCYSKFAKQIKIIHCPILSAT